MKLKILHLTQFLGIGGLEKVLFLLITEQLKAGHEVVLMVYDHDQTWVEEFRKSGITVDTTYRKNSGYDRGLLKHISKYTKSFDVVHTHDLNPLMYAAPAKFLRKLKGQRTPKLIHTAHGMDHLHKRPITKLYERVCGTMTNFTVGVSTAVCDYYLNLGLTPSRVINIDNGTQVLDFTQEQKQLARQKLVQELQLDPVLPIWVCVARIVPLKDQKLISALAHRCPDMNFVLVGPSGNDEYFHELKQQKPSNVFMTGGRSDITDLLNASDFFISASTHEGIPVSVLEAGAVKLPCLLSDIPGHKVIQACSSDGIASYFKVTNLEDLIEKAIQLKNNKTLALSIAAALHRHVRDNFSSTKMYKRYLEVYLG
jgi:glycosyltransferase involved in cell wall biosynthesis